MVHINILRGTEQLYFISNEKAIPASSIDLDRGKTVTIHNSISSRTFNTNEIGVLNLNTDLEYPIDEYDFVDEF